MPGRIGAVTSTAVPAALAASLRQLGEPGRRWLVDLPGVVAGLAEAWGLTLGESLEGGNTAFVVAATDEDGRSLVLKVAMPEGVEGFAPFEQEMTTLLLAGGDPYVQVVRHHAGHRALLLERLGQPLARLGLSTIEKLTITAHTLRRGWRPVPDSHLLPHGDDKASRLVDMIRRDWEQLGHPCSRAAIEQAGRSAEERAVGFRASEAVLIHGDAHTDNVLQVVGRPGEFRLIDPEGLLSEPEHDIGVLLRDGNTELLANDTLDLARERCLHVAGIAGVDPVPAWQWSCIERIATGLFLLRLGYQREGREFLEVADRLAAGGPLP